MAEVKFIFEESTSEGERIYLEWFARIAPHRIGDEAMNVILREMREDPEFALHAEEIIMACKDTTGWVAARINAAAWLSIRLAQESEKRKLVNMTNFGRF